MKKWEYSVTYLSPVDEENAEPEIEGLLNRFGSNGWELVSVQPAKPRGFNFYFKREVVVRGVMDA